MPEDNKKSTPKNDLPQKSEKKLVTHRPEASVNPSIVKHSLNPDSKLSTRPKTTKYPSNIMKASYVKNNPDNDKPQTERPETTTEPSTSTKDQGSSKKDK